MFGSGKGERLPGEEHRGADWHDDDYDYSDHEDDCDYDHDHDHDSYQDNHD